MGILKHGRETISLEDVIEALNSKELQRRNEINGSCPFKLLN